MIFRLLYTSYVYFEYVLRTLFSVFAFLWLLTTPPTVLHILINTVITIIIVSSFIWRETPIVINILYYVIFGVYVKMAFDYGFIALLYPIVVLLLHIVYTVRTNPSFLRIHEKLVEDEIRSLVNNLDYNAFLSIFSGKK